MHRPLATRSARFVALPTLALVLTLAFVALSPRPVHGDSQATQTFHLVEIYKIMAGYNGNMAIQAVEMRMNAAGQEFVNTATISTYNANGIPVATLGTFAADVLNGTAGARILCATTAFQTTFGITADLTIAAGIPAMTGQVSFEGPGCPVNTIPYGNVNVPINSTTVAPFLPVQGATILIRRIDTPGTFSCPLNESAGLRFQQKQGTAASPDTFTNNAGQSVFVSSTVTGVGETSPVAPMVRVSPNPFSESVTIELAARAIGWTAEFVLQVFDQRGALIRTLTEPGPQSLSIAWDGRNAEGRRVASGVYWLQFRMGDYREMRPVLLVR